MNRKIPELSVVIPVYNVQNYISECLDTILNQTLEEIEVICVIEDDITGSRDILDDYRKKDNRVKIVYAEKRGRINYSRRSGYNASSGRFVTFVDADDWVEPDIYEQVLRQMDETHSDVAIYGFEQNWSNGKIIKNNSLNKEWTDSKENRYKLVLACICFKCNPVADRDEAAMFNKVYSRELLKRIDNSPYFIPKVIHCEDAYHNMLCFHEAENIIFIDTIGYHQRRNVNRNSSSFRYRKSLPDNEDIRFYEDFGKQDWIDDVYFTAMHSMIVNVFVPYAFFSHYFRKENPKTILEQFTEIDGLLKRDADSSSFPLRKALDNCNPDWIRRRPMRLLVKIKMVRPWSLYLCSLYFRLKEALLGYV